MHQLTATRIYVSKTVINRGEKLETIIQCKIKDSVQHFLIVFSLLNYLATVSRPLGSNARDLSTRPVAIHYPTQIDNMNSPSKLTSIIN